MKISIKIIIFGLVFVITCFQYTNCLTDNTAGSVSKPSLNDKGNRLNKNKSNADPKSLITRLKKRDIARSNKALFRQFLRRRKNKIGKINRKPKTDSNSNNNNQYPKNNTDFRFKQENNLHNNKEEEGHDDTSFHNYPQLKIIILLPIVLAIVAMTVTSVIGFIALIINQTSVKAENGGTNTSPIRRNIAHLKLTSSEIAEICWLKQHLVRDNGANEGALNQRPEPIT